MQVFGISDGKVVGEGLAVGVEKPAFESDVAGQPAFGLAADRQLKPLDEAARTVTEAGFQAQDAWALDHGYPAGFSVQDFGRVSGDQIELLFQGCDAQVAHNLGIHLRESLEAVQLMVVADFDGGGSGQIRSWWSSL